MSESPRRRIYLDYNATCPLADPVREAIQAAAEGPFGNPSSTHWAGQEARAALTEARRQLALLLGATEQEIVFTSGGSEANNFAIKGIFWRAAQRFRHPHFVTSAIEHPAVHAPLGFLQRLGAEVTFVPVDRFGQVDPDDVRRALRPQTVLVTIMHANNEVGTLQPIAEIARICREHDVCFHTDAAQSVGKTTVDVARLGCDLLSLAGHKFYAPKGVGALYVREGVELEPLVHGAGHERGRRAGTENLLLDVALGAAAELARTDPAEAHLKSLADRLLERLHELLDDAVVLNGHPTERIPNTVNVSFLGVSGRELLERVPDVAASTGSACHERGGAVSHVLAAMGLDRARQLGAVRLSVGRMTTQDEVDEAAELLATAYRHLTGRSTESVSV